MNIWKVSFTSLILFALTTGCGLRERVTYRCSKLPDVASVEKTLSDQGQVVDQIKNIHPGFIEIGVYKLEDCSGKARIKILYATEQDRQEIEQIIGDTFFGIPYEMQNI